MFRKISLIAILLLAVGGVTLAVPSQASALSNKGPDALDLGSPVDGSGNPTDTDGYIITSADYGSAVITTSVVPIYFKDNIGNKTIVITDGNQCTDKRYSAPAGGNAVDTTTGSNPDGAIAAFFYVTNIVSGVKSTVASSTIDGSIDCYNKTITIKFNASKFLTFDPTIGMYVAQFNSDTNLAMNGIENRFRIELEPSAPTTAIVGYSSKIDPSSFGVGHDYPPGQLRDYSLPFAPDCGVKVASDVNLVLYDLDNGTLAVQGNYWIKTYVEEIDSSGAITRIPLTFTTKADPASSTIPSSGDQNGYIIDSNQSKQYVYTHLTVKPGFKYKLNLTQVYARNILQFQLPYDSIYFSASTCPLTPPPPPPPPPSPPPKRPFFEANGGDVAAGASFATDPSMPCSVAPHIQKAGVVSWNFDGSPNYSGAGGQYAAFALNFIQDFVTGKGNGVPSANSASELSFANDDTGNSIDPAGGLFGGMFGAAPCADFWNDHPGATTPIPGGDVSSWPSGVYYTTSNLSLATTGNVTVPAGKHITIYVDGDVAIGNDIVYDTAAWVSRANIPSFRLIVHGTIYVDKQVANLDGLYAAIPTTGDSAKPNQFAAPNAGTISTCSSGFTSYDPTKILTTYPTFMADCSKRLVFTGSVVAQQIWLLRDFGDLGGQSAEVFNYSPEVWLAPSGGSSGGIGTQEYQSVVGLPPIL